jgi:phosphohistidine phosphatase SixA
MLQRRQFHAFAIALTGVASLPARADTVAERLREGRCAVLLRHGQTTAGIGDPPGFKLGQCSTQRNLSDEGKAASRRLGAWFKQRGLVPQAVRSSAWCRCKDTADLAFGQHVVWEPLSSTFNDDWRASSAADGTAALRTALAAIPAGRFEVWVTHQVNITALTGEFVQMGEGLVIDAAGAMQGRSRFE